MLEQYVADRELNAQRHLLCSPAVECLYLYHPVPGGIERATAQDLALAPHDVPAPTAERFLTLTELKLFAQSCAQVAIATSRQRMAHLSSGL